MTGARLVRYEGSPRQCSSFRCRSRATHMFTTAVRVKRGRHKGKHRQYTRYPCDYHAQRLRQIFHIAPPTPRPTTNDAQADTLEYMRLGIT